MSSSSRGSKRKHDVQEDQDSEEVPEKRERLSSDDGGPSVTVSRTGRVRKKSSKILEMEEGMDDLEEALGARAKARKKSEAEKQKAGKSNLLQSGKKKSDSQTIVLSPDSNNKNIVKIVLSPPKAEPEPEATPAKSGKKSRSKKGEKESPATSPVAASNIKTEPDGSIKMKLHITQSPPAETSKSKKSKGKKDKEPLSPLPPLDIPENQDVTIKEGDSGLKLKLILSPKDKGKETEAAEDKKKKKRPAKGESKSARKPKERKEKESSGIEKIKIKDILALQQAARDAKAREEQQRQQEQAQLMQTSTLAMHLAGTTVQAAIAPISIAVPEQAQVVSPPVEDDVKSSSKKKAKKKKIKTEPPDPDAVMEGIPAEDDESMGGNLEIDLSAAESKKKKESKKSPKKSPKIKIKKEPLEIRAEPFNPIMVTQYANTDSMAMKLKTSKEKKASKKKKKLPVDPNKPKTKRRRGLTAYMLWCNSYRNKVIAENPERDFAQISKRLGEIWQGLPEKEKLSWKRKAKKISAKGSTLISTGKQGGKVHGGGSKITSTGPSVKASSKVSADTSKEIPTQYEVHSTAAIDVAAHLKLLGESLSIIGNRLTESRGQIAVQGSLSVMLDSLLCALGPLVCLTSHVEETQSIPDATLAQTLDNIAYFMPGL